MATYTFPTGTDYSLYRISDNTHFGGGSTGSPEWTITESGTPAQQDGTFDTVEFVQMNTGGSILGGNYQGQVDIGGTDYPVFSLGGTYFYVFGINTLGTPSSIDPSSFDTADYPICFAAGTMIRTQTTEVSVETLNIGDEIRTAAGDLVKVKWIGRQTMHKLLSGSHMQPVRIRAGALGAGQPHSDLTVTAHHGMVLDGMVINACALINGGSIDWVPLDELPDSFTVYHVETEAHDVILANGAPSETFIDYRDRRAFDNFDEYLALYGCERIIPEMTMPQISSARLVPQAIKDRLGIPAEPGRARVA